MRTALDELRGLGEACDAGELGARLMAAVVDPQRSAARRVWLLRLPERSAAFVMERIWGSPPLGSSLDVGPAVGTLAGAPGTFPLASLDPIPLSAWRDRGMALGEPGGGQPWSDCPRIAAFFYRTGAEGWLLLAALSDDSGSQHAAAFATLAGAAQLAARSLEQRESARLHARQRDALIAQAHSGARSGHLLEALRADLEAALRGSGASGAALWRSVGPQPLRLELTAGALAERESLARALEPLAALVASDGRARHLDRPVEHDELSREVGERFARLVCLPLSGRQRRLGVLALFDESGGVGLRLETGEHELLRALAEGLAERMEQAERWDALRHAEAQIGELRARLRRRERLATLGEIAARLAREARHPLASIGAFARRAHRELDESDPHREYLEVVIRETERLERMLGEPLEAAGAEPPNLKLESLNAVIQEALPGIGERLVRRRVRLLKRLDPESPLLLLDPARMRQVVVNLLEHAVESVPVGGRVRVESRLVRDHVVVEISFDARREPGGLLEPLYVSFRPGEGPRGGPALHLADHVVRGHGGEIRVRSDSEWGATVMLTIPVAGNGDRRRGGPDRREAARDRRRPPEER